MSQFFMTVKIMNAYQYLFLWSFFFLTIQSLIQFFFWTFGFLKAIIYFFKFLNFQKTIIQPVLREEDAEPAELALICFGTFIQENCMTKQFRNWLWLCGYPTKGCSKY